MIVGVVMLKPGWMNRYLPAIAQSVVPDVAVILGFIWAGLMFASALTNAFIALKFSLATWALVMPTFGIISKLLLFLAGFAACASLANVACAPCRNLNVKPCWRPWVDNVTGPQTPAARWHDG